MSNQPNLDRFRSRRSTVYGPNGVVATSQPLAAQTGLQTLQRGGNAFDAAVATAATLNVVEPVATGLGGDVFGLFKPADGDVIGMRSCGYAPEEATIENVRNAVSREQGVSPEEAEMPHRGAQTVTVPGTARGWELTVDRWGQMSLGDVLAPAIGYAKNSYPVSEIIADWWSAADDLFSSPHAREAYLFDDEPPETGQMVTFPQLGDSLSKIAEHGADIVYEGEIGEKIVEEVNSNGGFLQLSDLKQFEPEILDPISTTYNGAEVYELPPNNQGMIALEALNIAEELGVSQYDPDDPERIHTLVESMKIAFTDGHYHITDPEFEAVPPLHSKAYAKRRASEVSDVPQESVSVGMPDSGGENSDTVLLTVADAEGNVVSYINSRYKGFGSGLVAGNTGIALQNRGGSFSLDPEHPNSLEPGKRPFHTLVPGIVRFDTDDWAAFGTMGGYMQPQGHFQILSNIIDCGLPIQEALDRPRWKVKESGALAVEGSFSGETLSKLARMGHDVRVETPDEFGGAQIARRDGEILSSATDPRKDGNALGY